MINYLAKYLDIVGVWQEKKSFNPTDYANSNTDNDVISDHFRQRDASEEHYFGNNSELRLSENCTRRLVAPGGINSPEQVEEMIKLKPAVVLVFGTSILGPDIIAAFQERIINLHLGLSPYYRGSGTNFWPLVNREPEYVGATIHYLDQGIDTGHILAHVRPDMDKEDGPHDLGNKTIIAAAEILAEAARQRARHKIGGIVQNNKGRLYQRKDFTADAVRQLYKNLAEGMISSYLADKRQRDARLDLVGLDGGM